mmetsp:Transcript_39336/g.63867  ORF Transcript_39336/g.63867 Transcript_39336/m.63867 type:complete len:81 (+) Transcript_39336:382-624(+)
MVKKGDISLRGISKLLQGFFHNSFPFVGTVPFLPVQGFFYQSPPVILAPVSLIHLTAGCEGKGRQILWCSSKTPLMLRCR